MDRDTLVKLWEDGHTAVQISLEMGERVIDVRKSLSSLGYDPDVRPLQKGVQRQPFLGAPGVDPPLRFLELLAKARASKPFGVPLFAFDNPTPTKLSYELAFGEGAPWSSTYPEVGNLSYRQLKKVTRDVLDRVTDTLLKEFG